MGQQIDFDDSTADVQAYVDERYNKLAEVRLPGASGLAKARPRYNCPMSDMKPRKSCSGCGSITCRFANRSDTAQRLRKQNQMIYICMNQ